MPHVAPVSEGRIFLSALRIPLFGETFTVVCLNNHRQLKYKGIPIFKLVQRPEEA
jgi:hypothetical protein